MWSWVKRHKTVFVAGGICAGAWCLLRKAGQLQEQGTEELDTVRLKEQNESNRHTCLAAALGLIPSVQEAVCGQLDVEAITAQLRTGPANKVALWETLRALCFARLVTGVCACTLLTVFLRVQLSILGGCMSLDLHSTQPATSSGSQSTAPTLVQKQYLSTVQFLLQEGVVQLAQAVQGAAEAILVSYSLKHQLTCEGVLQIISDIRQQASASPSAHHGTLQVQEARSCLLQYMLPKEPLLQANSGDSQHLLAATRDMLESDDFGSVLESALDQAFAQLGRSLTEAYHSAAQSSLTLPLARIIPLITDHTPVIFSAEGPKSIAAELLSGTDLHQFAENILEAFRNKS